MRTFVWFSLLSLLANLQFSCSFTPQTVSSNVVGNQEVLNSIIDTTEFDVNEVEKNKNLWNESKITNYKLVFNKLEDGMDVIEIPFVVEVRDGKDMSIKALDRNYGSVNNTFKRYGTVGKMFERIELAQKQKAITIKVEYDTKLGFPRKIFIDKSKFSDDELFWKIKNLKL